jgi:cell wall-associated NlpC family hydrolase
MINWLIISVVSMMVLTLSPILVQAGKGGIPLGASKIQSQMPLHVSSKGREQYSQNGAVSLTPELMKVIFRREACLSRETLDLLLARACYYLNTPYGRGRSLQTSGTTDCSGFVQYIFKNFKINLPRSSAEQAQVGKIVSRTMDFSKMLPGDLLFFSRKGRLIGHAGIYLGEGKMIHASSYRHGVIITDLRQRYYEGNFVVAKRVFDIQYPQ